MSGVYIKGMEMPTSCWDCEVGGAQQMDNATCPFYSMDYLEQENYQDKIADGCPLVPVPKHGDLIDRKTAYDSLLYGMVMTGYQSRALDCISDFYVPTIIPADKE